MTFWDVVSRVRTGGMNGREIYHNFHGGTGDDGAGLGLASGKVLLITKNYEERTKSITELTGRMESAWQGSAGGAAQRGAGPLAVEHGLAQESMFTAHSTLDSQVSAFVTAKKAVTDVPPEPDKPGVWDNLSSFGGAGRTYENQMTQVNAANDNNIAAMETYANTTTSNATAMPTTYGRITDDYSAVGIERPAPPPPPEDRYTPPPGTGTPGRNTGNGTGNGSGTVPGGSSGQGSGSGGSGGSGSGGGSTNPSNNNSRPPSTTLPPGGRLPTGQNANQQNNHAMPGMLPPGFNQPGGGDTSRGGGGGNRGAFGPRGSGGGFGPGGSGGSGSGGPGSGSGARPGSGFGPGGAAAAAEGAAARGMGPAGGRGMGMGGMGGGMGGHGAGGRGQQGEDDTEHERPSFLVEPDPHDTFGTDEVTAPPVIGE
jgi:hypothetical protein